MHKNFLLPVEISEFSSQYKLVCIHGKFKNINPNNQLK